MQDNAAREFARKSLIQGKNFVTGEPITNKEADILMQVADMPKGKSLLSTIESFLTGKPSIEIDDRPPIDTELRRTTYEPQEAIDTRQDVSKLYGDRQFTPETIGEDPQQQYYGPPGKFQNIIEKQTGQTVSQEAKEIIDNAEQERIDKINKANRDFGNRIKKIKEIPGKILEGATDLFGVTGLGNLDQKVFSMAKGQSTTTSELLLQGDKYDAEDISTLNQFHMSEASVPFDKLDESPTIPKKDGKFTVYEDTEGFLTAGPGVKILADDGSELPKVTEMSPEQVAYYKNKTYDGQGLQRALLKIYDEKKAFVENKYGDDLAKLPSAVQSVVKRTLIDMNMQIKGGTSGFNMMNKALEEGNIGEMALQITGNYKDAEGNSVFSTAPGARKVGNTKYFDQMSGDKGDVLTDGNRAFRHFANLDAVKDFTKIQQPPAVPDFVRMGGGTSAPDTDASQPLDQKFVPPQAPTADQIRLAGGLDAFARSQLPTGTEQKAQGLQDLPVGVSIEADGQFTGTGGLGDQTQTAFGLSPGALGGRIVETPQVSQRRRRDTPTSTGLLEFGGTGGGAKTRLDSRARLKEQASLGRLQDSIAQTGAVQPPSMDDQMAIITDVTPAAPESLVLRQQPPISPGGMGGVLPQVGETAPQPITPFTRLSKPSDIAKLMPSTADIEAQKAAEARKAREEQEKKIYEETQARIAKQMADAAKEEQQKKARLEAEATEKARLEALKKDREERDRIKKTNQMNQARNEVIMAGGDPFEADKAAHAVFLDQSDAIRRNEELNKGKTLTQVIQEENRREEDSGGGSGGGGFGGGSPGGGGDDKIVCTEMYRQTQLVDWQKAMKIWDVYQRRYLTPEHQIGYHWLFKPYVKGMQNNKLLTKLGAILAKKRTQHLKHILTKGKAKDDLVVKRRRPDENQPQQKE
jgi:hypothetical protein